MPSSSKDKLVKFVRNNFAPIILAIVVLAFGGLAASTILALTIWYERLGTPPNIEVFKLIYQFLLIAVIGGIGTFLLSEYSKDREAQREKRAQERALQREFRRDLLQAYNAGKRVRRLLRVKIRRSEIKKQASPYDKLMEELVATQLQFELLKEEAPTLFPNVDGHNDIHSKLEKVEKYLNTIVSEYEKGEEFGRLEGFVAKPGELGFGAFKKCFSRPVRHVAEEVRKLLTEDNRGGRRET